MNPIAKQILWIAVFFIGLGLQAMPELFRKNERAYKITGTWVRNLGILIFIVPIILAPFDAQPRIEGILGFSFRIIGIILAVLGITFIAVASKHLLRVAGPEQIPRELITDGIYGKVRNPIYTGVILFTIGWSLIWGAIYSFFIITGIVILILLALIKSLEEPMLTRGQILGVQKKSANAFSVAYNGTNNCIDNYNDSLCGYWCNSTHIIILLEGCARNFI
ncbi:methyltransferase family protein [Palaeococcus sp. (in: euryarchaeotes)]